METNTPLSHEEREEMAQSFYKDFKVTYENWLEDDDPRRPAEYPFLFLEEARDHGPFDMSKECGFRHTDNIDHLASVMCRAVDLAFEDRDLEQERGNAQDIAIGRLGIWQSRLQSISKQREREGLPKTAEPKPEAQEISDATEAIFAEIQANIQQHGRASYATEKNPDDPTVTTNRRTDYLPKNLLKLSKILLGVSARIGEAMKQDPEHKDQYQQLVTEIHQTLITNLVGIIERPQTTDPAPKRSRKQRRGRSSAQI